MPSCTAAALDEMAGCVLAYPSYPIDVPDTVDARLGHCLTLRAEHGLELGPIDVSTVNLVLWDPRAGVRRAARAARWATR